MGAWHWLVHFIGADLGARYGHFVPGDFWSGFGSDLGEVTLAGTLVEGGRRAARLARKHHGERLAQAADHHEELKRHITETMAGGGQ